LANIGFSTDLTITSPDGNLKVSIKVEKGSPFYSVSRLGKPVINSSQLGFILKNQPPLAWNWEIQNTEQNHVDHTWTQPWGEKKVIRNHYQELKISLKEKKAEPRVMNLVFRVFNDGIGFRYQIPKQRHLDQFEIMDELTEFRLTGDHKTWFIPAFAPNRYEYLYHEKPVSGLNVVHTPVTMETADGLFLSFHEAALTDYSCMALAQRGEYTLTAELFPWADGTKVKGSTPLETPWRTILITESAGDLITSYLVLNLNEPNRLGDVSWIKPGKYLGIWWHMHIGTHTWGSGKRHGATTKNALSHIDFASKYGFDGVLIEGWNIGWDGDWTKNGELFNFTKAYDDFDIKSITAYAKKKGVRLVGHHETAGAIDNYEKQMEEAFALYHKLGVKVVKTGYVNWGTGIKRKDKYGLEHGEWHHGQYMVRHYRKALKCAARHKVMIIAHEPIKATGIRRTYPNFISREGARGQEYNAWDGDGGNPPEHTTILPFTRMLSGPFDFTPGIFDLHFNEQRPNNRVNTTLAKQLALYIVIYSPMQMAADLPQNYQKNLPAFQFILDVATDWEETRVLHAKIGDYVTFVRKDRHSPDWFLGSITDEEARTLETVLKFLPERKKYVAEIYRDGDNADCKTNPYSLKIYKAIVDNHTRLKLKLATSGGQAIRFRPAKKRDLKTIKSYEE
jgi:alpha-glucosidase